MSEHKNILKKIRCVKSEYLDESLLIYKRKWY